MEPNSETVDQPEAGTTQHKDDDRELEAVEEQETKSLEAVVDVKPPDLVGDTTENNANVGTNLENGSRSPLTFPSVLCPEEGLAGRIGLVELGKGTDSENGKGCTTAVSPVTVQPTCGSVDGCLGTEGGSGTQVPTDNQDSSNPIDTLMGVELKEELNAVETLNVSSGSNGEVTSVVHNGSSSNEKVEPASSSCHGNNKGVPCTKANLSDAEMGCSGEGEPAAAPDAQPGVRDCDVGTKEGCAGGCAVPCAVEESPCADGRAKKRRAEDGGSDVDGGRVENEAVGDRWRKRRKRKSRRKAPNVSMSPSSASSSGDERETQRRPQHGRKQAREEAAVSEDEQQFCLRWNNFLTNITSQFGTLRDDEDFVDVTLACGGMHVKAHRVVLSACSPYFKRMFKSVPYCQHPVVFLEGINPSHLLSLLAFMYCGEVGVGRGQLPSLLSAAHALQIRGLTEMGSTANGSARSGEDGDDDEEKVILSARRQAMAVEKVLKDIGFSEVEGAAGRRSGCVMNLPKASSSRGERSSSLTTRQKLGEMKLVEERTEGSNLSNGLGEEQAVGNCLDGTVPGITGVELNGDEGGESHRCTERRTWPNTVAKHHSASSSTSSQQPLVPVATEMNVPSTTQCARKGHRDANNLLNCGITSEDTVTRVNSHRPDSMLMCNMAASLVDVHMGSSPAGEDDERTKNLEESAPRNNPMQTSPAPDVRGTGMERHGWDPGEEGLRESTSHFEPRIDLVMGTELIKPKEEFVNFGSDVDDNMSLSNVIEPKTEYQEVSSAEGETSCGVPMVAVPSGPSLSLVSLNEQHQTYRPHILSSPIVSVMQQQQPRPSPSAASSHVYSHFLPPIGGTTSSVPHHASSRLSPGTLANVAGDRRGGGGSDAVGGSGSGHLKWEMPRPCPVCRRIYSNNSNLRRHLRTIHEEYYETHI